MLATVPKLFPHIVRISNVRVNSRKMESSGEAADRVVLFGTSYHAKFDPKVYLSEMYPSKMLSWHPAVLACFHEFFEAYGATAPQQVKLLNYGAGPIVVYEISSSQYATEIVLSEYTERNRAELQLWMNGDPKAHDFSQYFKYVVQELEGKSEQEAFERQEKLRRAVKAIVSCDITQDPIVCKGYESPYDVVVCSMCLLDACNTWESYTVAMEKLVKLVKPGGKLVILSVERPQLGVTETQYYKSGENLFSVLIITKELLLNSLQQAGCSQIEIKRLPCDYNFIGATGILFVSATKD